MKDIRDAFLGAACNSIGFICFAAARQIHSKKKKRFLLVAVTELLPMYQSPNVSIHPRVLRFAQEKGNKL